ncbi:MAG: Mini-ribonuclease 3 [Clostridia bacterium]|nr:Mini-ribonuclease 3 [Clostridia bacterium]
MHDKIIGASLPSVMALSYVGDAVHSLYIRKMLVKGGLCKSGELNAAALDYVTAEAQASVMRRIEPHLSEDEHATYKRALNSTHLNKPKHASAADYRAATGFEAVVGMLEWIGDTDRLSYLMELAYGDVSKSNDNN